MRWFKHLSDMRNDHKIKLIRYKLGNESYAVWCMLLEIYAEACGKNPDQNLSFSIEILRKDLGISMTKLEKFLRFFSDISLLLCDFSEKNVQIQIPKMACIKDNHTRNLQVADKLVSPNKKKKEEGEEDKEKEEEREKLLIDKIGLPDWLPEEKLNEFKKFRRDLKSPMSDLAVKLLVTELTKLKNEGQDPIKCLEQSILSGWKSVYAIKKDSVQNQVSTADQLRRKEGEARCIAFMEEIKNWEYMLDRSTGNVYHKSEWHLEPERMAFSGMTVLWVGGGSINWTDVQQAFEPATESGGAF